MLMLVYYRTWLRVPDTHWRPFTRLQIIYSSSNEVTIRFTQTKETCVVGHHIQMANVLPFGLLSVLTFLSVHCAANYLGKVISMGNQIVSSEIRE